MVNHQEEVFQKKSKIKAKILLQLTKINPLLKLQQKLERKLNQDFSNMKTIKNWKKLKKIICSSKKRNIKNLKQNQCSNLEKRQKKKGRR
jgi:hypothetical protein